MLRKRLTLLSWTSASGTVTPDSASEAAGAPAFISPEKLRDLRLVYLERHFKAISSKASKTKEQLEGEKSRREESARQRSHYKSLYDSIAATYQNEDSKKDPSSRQLSLPRSSGRSASYARSNVRRRTSRLLNNPQLVFRDYAEFVDIPTDRAHIHVEDRAAVVDTEDEPDGIEETKGNASMPPTIPGEAERDSGHHSTAVQFSSQPPQPGQLKHATCRFCRTAHAVGSTSEAGTSEADGGLRKATLLELLSGHDTDRLRAVYERGRHRARARRQRLAELFAEPIRGLCAALPSRLSSMSLRSPSVEASG